MANQRVWLPPMDLWKWYSQAAVYGLLLYEQEELNPSQYVAAWEGKLEGLVKKVLDEEGPKELVYMVDNFFPGMEIYLEPEKGAEYLTQQLMGYDLVVLDVHPYSLQQLLEGKISLEEYKRDFGLEEENKGLETKEEAESAVREFTLLELLADYQYF